MELIPAHIETSQSNAENRLFAMLQRQEGFDGWTAFHSLNLSRHSRKRWAELDFVLVGPDCVLVLEVKGGRVAVRDGVWVFTDRWGGEHKKREGPFGQARTGMYALLDLAAERFGSAMTGKFVWGWGVVFPDIPWAVESPEMPSAVVCDIDRTRGSNGLGQYLKGLRKRWIESIHGNRAGPPTRTECSELKRWLRPNFDLIPGLDAEGRRLDEMLLSLTNDQYKFIDLLEPTDRLVCLGGAGSGKSLLAVETARREMRSGRSVALVCFSPVFRDFLVKQVSPECQVLSLSDLHDCNGSKVDALIVDEGQDILNDDALAILDGLIDGGIEGGRWRWFMDPNNQVGVDGQYDTSADELLRSFSGAEIRLTRNVRNTEQIVDQATRLTGADIGEAEVRGIGRPVIYQRITTREDAARSLDQQVETWLAGGVEPGEIAILSTVPFDDSCAKLLPRGRRRTIVKLDGRGLPDDSFGHFIWSRVRDFKGLERRCIALVDLEKTPDELGEATLYVAMTRAFSDLWIATTEEVTESLGRMLNRNSAKG